MVDHGGTLGAVGRKHIIRLRSRPQGIHSANCDDVWIHTRSTNQTIPMSSELVATARVSRRRDYHHTCLPSCFGCLTERVLSKAFVNWPSQRKVQDANVVCIFQSDGALDGRNNVGV